MQVLEDGTVQLRDSKEVRRVGAENAQVLNFTPAEWAALVAGVKDGEFDLEAITS